MRSIKTKSSFIHQSWELFVVDGYQYLMFHSCIMLKNLLFRSEAFEASLILSYCFCLGFLTHISIPFIASMYWIQIANFLHFFVLKVLLTRLFKNLCIRQHMYIYTHTNTKEPIGTKSQILGNTTTTIRSSACRLKL